MDNILSLNYVKLIFEEIITIVDIENKNLVKHMVDASPLRHYYEGKTDGMLEVVDIISKYLENPIRDEETIKEYYIRWLSGFE